MSYLCFHSIDMLTNDSQNQTPTIHVGLLVMHSPLADVSPLKAFTRRMADGALTELQDATDTSWTFHEEEPVRLSNDEARYPSDFVDIASFRKTEGPYDALVVVTDVPLVSRYRQVVPGLASAVTRIIVISTRKFIISPRNQPVRKLDDASVQHNSIALMLHLFGHLFGLQHISEGSGAMATYRFDENRKSPLHFSESSRRKMRSKAAGFPDEVKEQDGIFHSLLFHIKSASKHPKDVLRPLWRNRAPLIPLSLPTLATAAVAPTIILIFSAEIWDVALHLTDSVAWLTGLSSIVLAAWYMMVSLKLFFPRKERRIITEHAAVANVTVFLTLLLAMAGLFFMILLVMLGLEYFVFPPDLMREWPSLDNPEVTTTDKIRLAVFIGTLGVVTGALAGGLESRTVVREFALFRKDI